MLEDKWIYVLLITSSPPDMTDIFFRIVLIILVGKLIYNMGCYVAINEKKKYFRLPAIASGSISQQQVVVFKPTVLELINKFSWSVMAIALLVVMSYRSGGTTTFLMLLFFGLPFLYRIISRLLHVSDRVTIGSREVAFSLRGMKEKVNVLLVKEIQLRYYLDKKGLKELHPEFIFRTGTKEQTVRLNDVFFLPKAERMLVTMQRLLPDRKLQIVWEDSLGYKDVLEVKS